MDPIQFQQQVRANAAKQQQELRELNSWANDVEETDEQLKKAKPTVNSSIPPVRGTVDARIAEQRSEPPKKTKIEPIDQPENPRVTAGHKVAIEEDEPTEADKHRIQGNAQFKKGDYMDAIISYTGAIQCDPESQDALTNRAFAFIKVGMNEQAVEDCETALKLNPTNVKALYRFALATKAIGDEQKKPELYHTALSSVALALSTEAGRKNKQITQLSTQLRDLTRGGEKKKVALQQGKQAEKQAGRTGKISISTDDAPQEVKPASQPAQVFQGPVFTEIDVPPQPATHLELQAHFNGLKAATGAVVAKYMEQLGPERLCKLLNALGHQVDGDHVYILLRGALALPSARGLEYCAGMLGVTGTGSMVTYMRVKAKKLAGEGVEVEALKAIIPTEFHEKVLKRLL
ncbi:TPR repeat [Carpediemonas membranifera]|uniref:TPR repeat n=1 Tax=Carpediemonas membranifera TaxID=201153 RepID=A0A8J6BXQ3_9EUKA|nr:TPR repeat [Carpediemonas membranifera]|eukprot:KAG9393726.1 TPR repeat [Carpediemonas membranifera]